jgi:hypothetical protein
MMSVSPFSSAKLHVQEGKVCIGPCVENHVHFSAVVQGLEGFLGEAVELAATYIPKGDQHQGYCYEALEALEAWYYHQSSWRNQ